MRVSDPLLGILLVSTLGLCRTSTSPETGRSQQKRPLRTCRLVVKKHTIDEAASTSTKIDAFRGGSATKVVDPRATTTESRGTSHENVIQVTGSPSQTARVLACFGLWYTLNVWYNIVNKRVLNVLPLPLSVAVLQLGIGSVWIGLQWALRLRARPGSIDGLGRRRLAPVSLFHGGGQLATVLSLGAGAVSFTHVVKAMEPFFSALVAAVCFQQIFRPQVYLALLPVVAGVSLACFKEINFSWVSFLGAMASNLFFTCRSNFSKALMIEPPTATGSPISAANLYGLVTIGAFLVFAPAVIVTKMGSWKSAWDTAMENGNDAKGLVTNLVLSGLSHYLNNEIMYLALGSVHPTTLAVGNTMKRVFIVVASLVVFKTPISWMGMLGSAIAVVGVLIYSLTKQHYDRVDRDLKA